MKLSFSIEYRTAWGQSLHIVLAYKRGEETVRQVNLPMQTGDGLTWLLDVAAVDNRQRPASHIVYYYQVENADGTVQRREWTQTSRCYTFDSTHDYIFHDFWLEEPLEFKYGHEVPSSQRRYNPVPVYPRTIFFAVRAPYLRDDETLALIGNHPTLGNWNPDRYLVMTEVGNDEWQLALNVFAVDCPVEYKYVIVDKNSRKLKFWERGDNRRLGKAQVYDNEVLVENGGEVRMMPENKVAAVKVVTSHPRELVSLLGTLADTRIAGFGWQKKTFDTFIFDLDGTLLDTLADLAASCNYALRESGLPERSIDEVRRFVGNGVRLLMERAIPDGADNPKFNAAYRLFRQHYLLHSLDTTQPYPGVMDVLRRLKDDGRQIAVVSNKFYAATQELVSHFFGDVVTVAIGERDDIRKKPAPDTVNEALRQLGASRLGAVYVGDSDVDIETARNSGMPCLSVAWGFRSRDFLAAHGATTILTRPEELLAF